MKIGIVDVFVEDQDRAHDFYTNALGLQIKTDAAYSADSRWLTVVSPEDPDCTQLMLAPLKRRRPSPASDPPRAGTSAVSFTTNDCHRRYRELRDRGVLFVSEPAAMGYGGIDAVF